MKDLWEYLTKLLKYWWILALGFVPNVEDICAAFTNYEPKIPFEFKLLWIGVAYLIASYMAWREEHNALLEYKSSKAHFNIHPKLYKIDFEPFKSFIRSKIEEYERKYEETPSRPEYLENLLHTFSTEPSRSAYLEDKRDLEEYLDFIEKIEESFNNTFILELKISVDRTEESISISVFPVEGKFVDIQELKFPIYPIIKTHPLFMAQIPKFPVINSVFTSNVVNEEVNTESASCAFKCIRKGEHVSFIEELVIVDPSEIIEFNVSIISRNSDGKVKSKFKIRPTDVEERLDFMKMDCFDSLVGDIEE